MSGERANGAVAALASADTKAAAAPSAAASAVVGMVGAGQLARMSQAAAIKLDLELRVLARTPGDSAAIASRNVVVGDPSDPEDLRRFAAGCDVVTFDHERVSTEAVRDLERRGCVVRPRPDALLMAQDKLHARRRLAAAGVPVPAIEPVGTALDAEAFGTRHGWPIVLKARRGGYDGRGIAFAADRAQAAEILAGGGEWLAEELVPIELELSQVLVRAPAGDCELYPLVRSIQRDGICVETRFPAEVDQALEREAASLAVRIAELIGATGVMAVELFVSDGRLVVNELALRPHNTGHWTIEGCETSQFENHLRAVLDLPIGSAAARAPAAVMCNVLGAPEARRRLAEALAVPRAHPHLYGKQPAPGRKVAHVTALGSDLREAAERSRRAARALGDRGPA